MTNSRYWRKTQAAICLQRFDRDVVFPETDDFICIGINDVWRQFDSPAIPDEQVSPEEYRVFNVER